MTGKNKKRRKNYFIKKKFQANFFMKFALLLIIEAVLIMTLFGVTSRGTLTAAYRGAQFTIERTPQYFLHEFSVIAVIIGAAIAVAGIFVFMFLSHRIAGALFRFEKVLGNACSGDLSGRVNLRKKDELIELKTKMNDFLETYDRDIASMQHQIGVCRSLVKDTHDAATAKKLSAVLKQLESSLNRYTTSHGTK